MEPLLRRLLPRLEMSRVGQLPRRVPFKTSTKNFGIVKQTLASFRILK